MFKIDHGIAPSDLSGRRLLHQILGFRLKEVQLGLPVLRQVNI
jgi:hypothetical protein